MFGKARRPFNLHSGTDVGFFRRMAQVRDGIAWYDEYSNAIKPAWVQALKNAYDGAGREKGVASTDNRTMSTHVYSAVMFSGQSQPTADVALFTRCIALNFSKTTRSSDAERIANELRTLEQGGIGSKLTAALLPLRGIVEKDFDFQYDDVRRAFTTMLVGEEIPDRLINNYCIPMAVMMVLSKHIPLGFSFSKMLDVFFARIKEQNSSISQEDDLATWWNIFRYYAERGELQHEDDFVVEMKAAITVRKPTGKNTETMPIDFGGVEKKILFVRFTKAYRFYSEQMRKENKGAPLNEQAVKFYLKGREYVLGIVRGKKFQGSTHECFALDMEKMPFDLPLSLIKAEADPF
jgi:hypothetical protein